MKLVKYQLVIGILLLLVTLNNADYLGIQGGYKTLIIMQIIYLFCNCVLKFCFVYIGLPLQFNINRHKTKVSFIGKLLLNVVIFSILTFGVLMCDNYFNYFHITGGIENYGRVSFWMYNVSVIGLCQEVDFVVRKITKKEKSDVVEE